MATPLFSKPKAEPSRTSLQAPIAAKPAAPAMGFAKKESPEFLALESKVKEHLTTITSRLRLVEGSAENLRDHINLLDNSLIEKHKTTISEVRSLGDEVRKIRSDIEVVKDFIDRLSKRMEAFASKQEFKVLERYVDMWQPMNYVTRPEVEALIKKVLKEQNLNIEEEVDE